MTGRAVTLVIPAHNEGERLFLTLEALRGSTGVPHRVVVIDDGSTDGTAAFLKEAPEAYPDVSLVEQPRGGVAAARNQGAREADTPWLLFMDAHCFPEPGWLERLLAAAERSGAGIVAPCLSVAGTSGLRGYGMTFTGNELGVEWLGRQADEPYEVPIAGGGCILMRRETFWSMGAFDAMRRYGVEDVELSIRCWLFGLPVVVAPDVEVAHVFKKECNFRVDWRDYLYNLLRMAVLHFEGERLGRIIAPMREKECFAETMAEVFTRDVWNRHAFVRARRVRDADWLCERFDLPL